jgi:hypothetical protein
MIRHSMPSNGTHAQRSLPHEVHRRDAITMHMSGCQRQGKCCEGVE